MIEHLNPSNICKVTSGVIVHGCNAQGAMGSGVAKQLRAKYPEIFYDYVENLAVYRVQSITALGQVVFVKVSPTLTIANAITQEFYGREDWVYLNYTALSIALNRVATKYPKDTPIHLPYLIGAGLAGGDPETILEIISDVFKEHTVYFHHWK